MAHSHDQNPDYNRAFALGIALNLGFVLAEGGFGVFAHSLALVADAGHNLSDVLGLALAWGASRLAARRPSGRRTYGLRRSTILAALVNAVVLLIAIGGIVWEAVRRLGRPEHVVGGVVMAVAGVGVFVNGATALLFLSGRKSDLNVRGAFLHMAADAGVSLGVVMAGLVILRTGWLWLDPVVSLVIAAVILIGTWALLRESLDLALDAVPEGIDPVAVEAYLSALPGVVGVHDLHIWGLSTTHSALTAHLVRPETRIDDGLVTRACRELHDRFGIEHSTIQIESGDAADTCDRASGDVV